MRDADLSRVIEQVVAVFRRHRLTHADIAKVLRSLVNGHLAQLAKLQPTVRQ